MKRALVVLAVLGLFTWAGFAQLSGSTSIFLWTEDLAAWDLYADLYLSYTTNGWTFSNFSIFGSDGFSYTQFGIKGALGPVSVSGTLRFNPAGTSLASIVIRNDIKLSMDFAGVNTGVWVFHDVVPGGGTFTLLPHRFGLRNVYCTDQWYISVTNAQTTEQGVMVAYVWAKVEGLRLDVFFTDPSTGMSFDTLLGETTIPLCCGISAETEFSFTKDEGLAWVKFILKDLSLCCGFTFDVRVQYSVNGKEVEIVPKFMGLEGCLTIYGGWLFEETVAEGIGIHGIGLKCALGDCTEIGFLNAFAPEYFWVGAWDLLGGNFPGMASTYFYRYYDAQPLPNWWRSYYTELFAEGENEVIWIKGCGAGCCGGQYSFEIDVFFAAGAENIFLGITRVRSLGSIPVTDNIDFSWLLEVSTTGVDLLGAGLSLSF